MQLEIIVLWKLYFQLYEDEEIDSLFPRNIISCSTYILCWSTEKTEYLTKDLEKLTKSKANEMDAQNPKLKPINKMGLAKGIKKYLKIENLPVREWKLHSPVGALSSTL